MASGIVDPVLLDAFLDLVLGSCCVGCARPGRAWCTGCARLLSGQAGAVLPEPRPAGLPPVWAVARNTGPVAAAVVAYKERGVAVLARPLAAALRQGLFAAANASVPGAAEDEGARGTDGGAPARRSSSVLVVPVPTSVQAVRRRGRDPVGTVARLAVRRCSPVGTAGIRLRLAPVLTLSRDVADQASLGASDRAVNLRGAYAVRESDASRVRGNSVLLLDDVTTTGSTLVEATRALVAVGATVRGAAVVATTPRRSSRERPRERVAPGERVPYLARPG